MNRILATTTERRLGLQDGAEAPALKQGLDGEPIELAGLGVAIRESRRDPFGVLHSVVGRCAGDGEDLMQRLLRWAVPLVGTLVLLVVLAGCAPRSDGSLTPVTWFDRYDADVDIWWRPWSPHAIAPDIPTHEIAEDCNDNGIDDRYDRIGYIPRGPYGTGEGPTLLAAATARTAGRGRKEVVVFNENPTTPGVDVFQPDWTHKLNRLASLRAD